MHKTAVVAIIFFRGQGICRPQVGSRDGSREDDSGAVLLGQNITGQSHGSHARSGRPDIGGLYQGSTRRVLQKIRPCTRNCRPPGRTDILFDLGSWKDEVRCRWPKQSRAGIPFRTSGGLFSPDTAVLC